MKIITETAASCPELDLRDATRPEDLLFFDIETTGLKKETTQVYLIGCAFCKDGTWMIRQYLAESALDEQLIMEQFADFAKGFRVLVHFNGEGFDIPYLAYKAAYYNLDFSFADFQSIDIYLLSKPLKKLLGLSSLKQKSIEQFLGIDREDLYGGGALIPVYYTFERTSDEEAERLLLLHNHDDVEGMLDLVKILDYRQIPEGKFSFSDGRIINHTAVLEYRLEKPLPAPFESIHDQDRIRLAAEGTLLQLNIALYEGCALLPLPDVENYYYLPEEDRVIHKDVAAFVDKSHRRKATRKNCFLKKEGLFLPQRKPLFEPAFEVAGQKRKTFFEVTEALPDNHRMLTEYALDILNC